MDRAVLATLSMPERQFVEQTQVAALASLDEDETADLLLRVRRTRNKYTKLYRRQASAQVSRQYGARCGQRQEPPHTWTRPRCSRTRFARVSRRLGALARQQADELRAERLLQAKSERQGRATLAPSGAAARDNQRRGGGPPPAADARAQEAGRLDQGHRRSAPGPEPRQRLTQLRGVRGRDGPRS